MLAPVQVAYIDSTREEGAESARQASVLLATVLGAEGLPPAAVEVYRVRLPTNTLTRTGIILGEGKGENQNHAVIFTRGECLQVRRPCL